MAEAIVGPLLSKLQEVVLKEATALAAVGGDIDKLRDKLMWLQALVHEADLRVRHDGSRLVRVLAFQIRDAGFDVEDAVDEFYLRASLSRRFGGDWWHRRFGGDWWRITKDLISNLPTHVFVRCFLSGRIRSINARLEEIIGNNGNYTLSQSGSGDGKSWRASRAIPPMREEWDRDYSKEFFLEYRHQDAEKLMEKIQKENTVSEVITVVGVEGVGKTALLTHAYEQEPIKKGFKRIWLSFPPDISEDSMIQQIKQELDNKKTNESRCLVVIDGSVRPTTGRKVVKQILKMVGDGSKIVLSVASSWHQEIIKQGTIIQGTIKPDDSKEGTHCTFKLGAMDEDHSLKLFHHIYDLGESKSKGTKYQVTEVNHIGSNIMEITNGLPLAVVLVAKLMRTMDFGKWKAAADYLKCNSEDNKLRTILSVCVDDLSDELKSCLLYTAGFPEMRPIDAHQLVRLWMAEGFLTQKHKLEMEELGQCYLKELIYRGLFQLIRKSSAHGGYVQWVAIPDQIHPLLRLEAQRTSFMDVHYGKYLPPPRNTRRLALHSYNNTFPALDNHLDKLRTVVSYSDDYTDYPYGPKQNKDNSSKNDPQHAHADPKQNKEDHSSEPKPEPEPQLRIRKFLRGSPYLRVINLEGINVVKRKKKGPVCALPHEIGEMVHLRYLGVRCKSLGKNLPSSVGNLHNLQTIDVRGTGVKELPESLWKVKTLRHVLGDELAFPRSSTTTGDDLKLMHTLESVTVKHQPDVAAQQQVQHNRCSTIIGWPRGKEPLHLHFSHLHRLHVAELEKSHGKALAYVLKGIKSLEALILSGGHIPMDWFAEASKATAPASDATAAEASKATAQEASAEATAAEAASEATVVEASEVIAPEALAEATAAEAASDATAAEAASDATAAEASKATDPEAAAEATIAEAASEATAVEASEAIAPEASAEATATEAASNATAAEASNATAAEASAEATAVEASEAIAPEAFAEATTAEVASDATAAEASKATAPEASAEAIASCLKHVEFLMLDGPLHLQEDTSNKQHLQEGTLSNKQLLVDYKCLRSCLENLTHLVLRSTKIGHEFIREIGKLLSLAELELLEGSYKDGDLFFSKDEFNSLTVLRISFLDTDTVKKISIPDGNTWRQMDISIDVPNKVKVSRQQASDKHNQQAGDTPRPRWERWLKAAVGTLVTVGTLAAVGLLLNGRADTNHPDKTLTEIILEAVNNNNSSKSTIIKYIKDIYVARHLHDMVNKSHELTCKIDHRGNNVYYINGVKKGTVNEETDKLTEMILEAVNNGDYSTETTIINYIKDKYVDRCLDSMVKSRMLISQKNGRYTKYYLKLASSLSVQKTVEDNAGPSSTEPQQS